MTYARRKDELSVLVGCILWGDKGWYHFLAENCVERALSMTPTFVHLCIYMYVFGYYKN